MSVLSNVELIFWNLGESAPDVYQARASLAAADLNHNHAENVPPSTAFRRAAKALAGKDTLARFWTRKSDGVLCVQIDSERENGDGRLHRDTLAVYALCGDLPQLVNGMPIDNMAEAYQAATRQYTGGDVSKIIQDILTKDGLGAYSPRKTGGVYFVPTDRGAPHLLPRVEQFAEAVGIRLLRYQIPDTGAQRDEIAQAVADSINLDLDGHGEAIAAYTTDTKAGHVANRREAINSTEALIERLAHLLGAKTFDLRSRIADLRAKLDDLAQEMESARQTSAPGRRIVGLLRGGN